MFSIYIRISILLCIAFVLLLAILAILSESDDPLEELRIDSEPCESVCLFGIRPGETTIAEATILLKNHPWIDDVQFTIPGYDFARAEISWSGKQPDVIDDSQYGQITFYVNDRSNPALSTDGLTANSITIHTHTQMVMFQKWLGESINSRISEEINDGLFYTIIYDNLNTSINLTIKLNCPISLESYWQAPVRMTISLGHDDNVQIRPANIIRIC